MSTNACITLEFFHCVLAYLLAPYALYFVSNTKLYTQASMAKQRALQAKREREEAESRRLSTFRARPLPLASVQNDSQNSPLLGLGFLEDQTQHQSSNPDRSQENEEPENSVDHGELSPDKKRRHNLSSPVRNNEKSRSRQQRCQEKQTSNDKHRRANNKRAQRQSMIKAMEAELNEQRKNLTR